MLASWPLPFTLGCTSSHILFRETYMLLFESRQIYSLILKLETLIWDFFFLKKEPSGGRQRYFENYKHVDSNMYFS